MGLPKGHIPLYSGAPAARTRAAVASATAAGPWHLEADADMEA